MAQVWATRAPLLCIHPGGPALIQRDEVLESWRYILAHPSAQTIMHSSEGVIHYGDFALVTCYEWDERQPENRLLAANGFIIEDDQYRMVTHHSGPLAVSADVAPKPGKPTTEAVH